MARRRLLLASSAAVAGTVAGLVSCASAPATTEKPLTSDSLGNSQIDASLTLDGTLVTLDAANPVQGDDADDLDASSPPQAPGAVFAHTPTTLYKLEPISKTLTLIGDFSCTATGDASGQPVIDIAVNSAGKMFGTTFASLLSIDPTTAACTVIATSDTSSFPNSLGFVPAGTVDPNSESLVGFADSTYVQVDTTTGAITTIGNLNPNPLGMTFQSSGDIVSLVGGKAYLTAIDVDPDAGPGGDYLLQIDPATGTVLKLVADTQKKLLYGLGYWGGTAYAFSANGGAYAIDLSNGFTTTLSFDNGPDPDAGGWYGAGSTPLAQ